MGADAGTPPGLVDRIRQIAADEVRKFARSGFLRNASISDGGLTIKGGFFRMLSKATGGVTQFFLGPVAPGLPDGTPQQGWLVNRADDTMVLGLYDSDTANGQFNQALSWFDRKGNVVFADDTDGGQGIARPWLSGHFAPARFNDWTVSTTSATFETLWEQRIDLQQPRLQVTYWASMDAAGTTGQTRVMVNGVQFGPTAAEAFLVPLRTVGPLPVAGGHLTEVLVQIQGRRTSTTGALRVQALNWKGRQS